MVATVEARVLVFSRYGALPWSRHRPLTSLPALPTAWVLTLLVMVLAQPMPTTIHPHAHALPALCVLSWGSLGRL